MTLRPRPTFVFVLLITITIGVLAVRPDRRHDAGRPVQRDDDSSLHHPDGFRAVDVGAHASALSLIFFIIVLAFALIQRALTKEDMSATTEEDEQEELAQLHPAGAARADVHPAPALFMLFSSLKPKDQILSDLTTFGRFTCPGTCRSTTIDVQPSPGSS